jgi:NhaP-type Na+/H+ or K+/H+ antiporter
MVNDAVAIILFKVVGGVFDELDKDGDEGSGLTAGTIAQIFWQFCYTVVVSLFIGCSIGKFLRLF